MTIHNFIHDERKRGMALQIVVLAVVLWLGYQAFANALAALERNNIATGFGFLDETAGFAINQTLIPYSEQSSYGRAFLVGLLNTLLVAAIGILLATVVGFVIGVARLSKNWLIAKIAAAYIEIFRNVPLLLQLFFWYFAVLRALPHPRASLSPGGGIYLNNRGLYVPDVTLLPGFWLWFGLLLITGGLVWLLWRRLKTASGSGVFSSAWGRWPLLLAAGGSYGLLLYFLVRWGAGPLIELEFPHKTRFNLVGGLRLTPEFAALLLALTIYTAAYIAEIVRAGIQAVDLGQWEAGRALGLPGPVILRQIILPQALRVIIPPLTSQYLNLTKNSSLAVAIAYPDLVSVFAGIVLNQTGQAVEVLALTMAVYLSLSLLTAAFMNWFNHRMALPTR